MDRMPIDKTRRYNLLVSEIDAVYHRAALRLGMTDSALRILYAICTYGDSCLLSDITRIAGISKQTINSALRRLETDEVVRLEACGARRKRVCLTAKGREIADATAERIIRLENEIFGSWSEAEWTVYFDLTQRFLTEIKIRIKEIER